MIFSFTWQIVSVCMTLTERESMPQPWKDTLMFCKTKKTSNFFSFIPGLESLSEPKWDLKARTSHLRLGLDVLAEEPLLVEGVASLARDGVDGALVDLLLDGTEQQEERLTHCFLEDTQVGEGGEKKKKKRSNQRATIPPLHWVSPTRGSCAVNIPI